MLKRVSYLTHQGPYLNTNEDLVDIDVDLNLYTVLDGFGGSNIGDVAVLEMRDVIKKGFTKISADEDSTMPFFYSSRYILESNALLNAFHQGHQYLVKSNSERKVEHRAGVAAMAFALGNELGTFVSCGNVRAVLLRHGRLKTIVAPENFEFLNATTEEQKSLAMLPSIALGLFEDVQFKVTEFLPKVGDVVLMLTDGMYSQLNDDELLNLLSQNSDDAEFLDALRDLSNQKGNWDNQSGIILRF